jgi:glycine betaine/choline ABC-type transport system substrate-binding protein
MPCTDQPMATREMDLICAFATEGRVAAYDLMPLKDDRGFFSPYQAAPVVRKECLTAHPQVGEALSLLAGILDNAAMQRLNFEVGGKKMRPANVARQFLKDNLITGDSQQQHSRHH